MRRIYEDVVKSAPSYRGSVSTIPRLDSLYERHIKSLDGRPDIKGMNYSGERPFVDQKTLQKEVSRGSFNIRNYPIDTTSETYYYNRDF